jgi:hypothetical protein
MPVPGFTTRWEEYRSERRKREQERQTWLILILCFGGMGLLLVLLSTQALPIIKEPYFLVILMVERIKEYFLWANAIQNVGRVILSFFPVGFNQFLVGLLTVALVGIIYTWIISIQRTDIRKGV